MRVLIVEDELKMASLVRRGLTEEGHAADIARTGDDALWMAEAHPYDAIVLDVMLPGLNGFETCRRLRQKGVWAPVLMLTARDAVDDRVAGLDAGADDYLTKPFSFAELLARLRALVRRGAVERPTELVVGDADNAGRPELMWQWLGAWIVVWTIAWLLVYLLTKYAKGLLADGRVLALPIALVIVLASAAILKFIADPAAGNRTLSIAVGGGMGWFMLLNVWGVIWRCQKRIIAWTKANAENGAPIPAEAARLGRLAFLVSRTNFWLSFPMLFFMAASSHFAFLSGK